MNKNTVLVRYNDYSLKCSDIARSLGFAGLALFWLYSNQGDEPDAILKLAALFIVFYFISDISQYLVGAYTWNYFRIHIESRHASDINAESEFLAPASINGATTYLFISKLVFVVVAYVFLIFFLLKKYLQVGNELRTAVIVLFIALIVGSLFLSYKISKSIKDINRWQPGGASQKNQ